MNSEIHRNNNINKKKYAFSFCVEDRQRTSYAPLRRRTWLVRMNL